MHDLNTTRRIYATVTRNGIACLFALWLRGGMNVLQKDIEYITGLTDKPIAAALRVLQAEGYIYRNRTGISLTRGGLQMFLIPAEIPSRRISDSLTSSINESINPQINEDTTTSESEKFRLDAVTAALTAAGIGEPARSELAEIPGLTADHISRWEKIKRAEIETAQSTGKKAYYSPGLLIATIRALPDNPPLPLDPDETITTWRATNAIPLICPACSTYPCQCEESEDE